MNGLLTEDRLRVVAEGHWPEETGEQLPMIAGFIHSTFNPLVAAAANRCLSRRPAGPDAVTAVILVTALGDATSAVHVAGAVDAGERIGPLFFFQSVPNAIAGHLAAKWHLTGPVVCVATIADGLAVADLLLADGDADEALVVRVYADSAAAVLVRPTDHAGRDTAVDVAGRDTAIDVAGRDTAIDVAGRDTAGSDTAVDVTSSTSASEGGPS